VSRVRLILVRHAEPADAVRGRIYGRLDVELSPGGLEAARGLAAMLAGESPSALYSSPLRRALATAEPLARASGLDVGVVPELREIDFGELEGLTSEEAAARYPVEARWTSAPAAASFPGGESVASLRARAADAVVEILARSDGGTVAVFSHAVVIRAILAGALAMPADAMFRLDQSYCGISIVEWFDGTPYVRVVNAPRL